MRLKILEFDTRIDTKKFFVPMTIKIKRRNYVNKDGESLLYLHVSSAGERQRIPLDIYVDPKYWIKEREILKGPEEHTELQNLLVANVKSKITKIKTFYKLSYQDLTMHAFIEEFTNNLPRANFVSFFEHMLEDRRNTIEDSTHRKELAVLNKLKNFQSEVLFYQIDQMWFTKFRNYLGRLGNKRTTRNANMKVIKLYIGFAVSAGVKLKVNLKDIKTGSTAGDKKYLNINEIEKLYKFYFSDFINANEKLALGYFLMGCFTGLRFSDLMQQKRESLLTGAFTFTHIKTKKAQSVKLNKKAMRIIDHNKQLFIDRYTPEHTRRLVKAICKKISIFKPVDFHTSRHSFGTNYILLGGNVMKLKGLLNHGDIKETMGYVHLAELERNSEADLMDQMFDD
ncbi:tyrosine-type recombinase/integrase [Sediminibacter sp. Hel_I_10]|uniref:tyrosine-type recombinase/integrase n=1 Tax=Sediminibacter sp. Hel_I_10 TaxID=1392490 RepID=UPI00047D46A1|nr:tyrosine-type recombinase/integrase [Sediminibacter sp. Hel_I_10]